MTDSLLTLNLDLLPRSYAQTPQLQAALVHTPAGKRLAVLASSSAVLSDFEGESSQAGEGALLLGPLSPRNIAALRAHLPWLKPGLMGLATSAGMGDRIGLATPGHVRALRAVGGGLAPVFAQQSIREMLRTGRTAQQVMDDATWGVFQEGWRGGMGADADHLKTPADIDACLAAGYTFFTIDPGDHVDNRAETADLSTLRELAEQLPPEVQVAACGLAGKTVEIEHLKLRFDEHTLLKAAVKYGKAVAHVAAMHRHLAQAAAGQPFELEVSVDETAQPTTHAEHVYVASELRRLGVRWVSLAPRYIGSFEKAVDYIGDLSAFEADIAGHAAVARYFGPYKLSLHSGSDKFSIYAAAVRQTRGLVHLKTAGTSYLEALRTTAAVDPDLFREIYAFSLGRYDTDKATYHVSAEVRLAPLPEETTDLPRLLNNFHAREILHICFGSVLLAQTPDGRRRFRDRLTALLQANAELYYSNLEKHFERHLSYFRPAA